MTGLIETTLQILPTRGRVVEGDVASQARCLRTLGHTGVRWWLDNRIYKISLLSDSVFRAVDTGVAAVVVAIVGELSGDAEEESARTGSVGERT